MFSLQNDANMFEIRDGETGMYTLYASDVLENSEQLALIWTGYEVNDAPADEKRKWKFSETPV